MCRVLTSQQRTPSNLRLVSPASASPFLLSRPPICQCDPVDTSKKGSHLGRTACYPTTPSSPRHIPPGTLLGSVMELEKGPFEKERGPQIYTEPPPRVGCGSYVSPGTKCTLKAQRGWLPRANPLLNIVQTVGPALTSLTLADPLVLDTTSVSTSTQR